MLNFKQNFILIFFVALCAISILYSILGASQDSDYTISEDVFQKTPESYFKAADYYFLAKGKENFHLFADELIHNQSSNDLILSGPNGVILTKNGDPIYYNAASGFLSMAIKKLYLKENVILRTPKLTITSEELNYDASTKILSAYGDVFSKTTNYDSMFEVVVNSQSLTYAQEKETASFSGNAKARVKRTRKYEPTIFFEASKMLFDLATKYMKLSDNVVIQKQELTASSRSGEVFFENYNKKLKYFALSDDVIVKEKVVTSNGESFERSAFSEKLEGFIAESKLVLIGSPKVFQKNDVLKGNKIILRENNETIEVDDANTNFRLR